MSESCRGWRSGWQWLCPVGLQAVNDSADGFGRSCWHPAVFPGADQAGGDVSRFLSLIDCPPAAVYGSGGRHGPHPSGRFIYFFNRSMWFCQGMCECAQWIKNWYKCQAAGVRPPPTAILSSWKLRYIRMIKTFTLTPTSWDEVSIWIEPTSLRL